MPIPLRDLRRPRLANAPPLVVRSVIWGRSIVYTNQQGREISVHCYEQARDYARANGYNGIKVEYV